MALTLYRRHIVGCPGSKLPGKLQRLYTDCTCPIWMYGRTEKEMVPRQSTGTEDWAVAEAMRRSLDDRAKDEAIHGSLLKDCVTRYCASRKNELTGKTLAYTKKVLERLCGFCARHGALRTDDLSVDLLETFKTEGLEAMPKPPKAWL